MKITCLYLKAPAIVAAIKLYFLKKSRNNSSEPDIKPL